MSSLIARLLGRRKPTSANITDQIDAQRAALADAQARAAASAEARRIALDEGDPMGLRAADEARDTARRDAEIAEHAIGALTRALAEAREIERRETFHADAAAVKRRGEAVRARLEIEYDQHAGALASILRELSDYYDAAEALSYRAVGLDEAVSLPNPEAFRNVMRLPDGSERLLSAVATLPGLRNGDPAHWQRRGS